MIAHLQTPALRLAKGAMEAASEHVLLLLRRFRLTYQQRLEVGRRIETVRDELSTSAGEVGQQLKHRDVQLLLSLPGVGKLVAATMLAEASQLLADRDYHRLRCYAGTAPVTRQSGKRKTVVMRRGCNHRLRTLYITGLGSVSQRIPVAESIMTFSVRLAIVTRERCEGSRTAGWRC